MSLSEETLQDYRDFFNDRRNDIQFRARASALALLAELDRLTAQREKLRGALEEISGWREKDPNFFGVDGFARAALEETAG